MNTGEIFRQHLDRMVFETMMGPDQLTYSAKIEIGENSLTITKLLGIVGEINRQILYYKADDSVEKGKICYYDGSELMTFCEEFFICHPDDLEWIRAELLPFRQLEPMPTNESP